MMLSWDANGSDFQTNKMVITFVAAKMMLGSIVKAKTTFRCYVYRFTEWYDLVYFGWETICG